MPTAKTAIKLTDLAFKEIQNYAQHTPSYGASCDLDFYMRLAYTLCTKLCMIMIALGADNIPFSKIFDADIEKSRQQIHVILKEGV